MSIYLNATLRKAIFFIKTSTSNPGLPESSVTLERIIYDTPYTGELFHIKNRRSANCGAPDT